MADDTKPRVLVVDDEPDMLELLQDALSDEGFLIETAGSGNDAIKLAKANSPDIVVTDLMLGDCTGLDVIDSLRTNVASDIPAIVITGMGDPETLTEASRYRPVELMTKPLDLDRLRLVVAEELVRRAGYEREKSRHKKLRRLAREINIQRKTIQSRLDSTCADLTVAYRTLSAQMANQQVLLGYQRELIGAKNDDDVFRSLFRLIVHRTGGVFGMALVCDSEAELQIAGRFGVPHPDEVTFCRELSKPLIDMVLAEPQCTLIDTGETPELFSESIRKFLPGLSALMIPLIPTQGELIGLVILYRKGEQPFTDADMELAEAIAQPTAIAVRRND
ncbi:MAG: response regulator [Phycisphaerales bacterium]|jgi:DNA-binding response OmpR family regulator|nr:response regulator [Phycisphaerales bacterium]